MKRQTHLLNLRLPIAVGLASLALTGWLWWHEQQSLDAKLRADFDLGVRQTASRIEQRVAHYEQMLRGARGLFDAAGQVEHADFQRFVDALMDGSEFLGLQAMVFTRWLDSPPSAPITYLAPDSPVNRTVLGHDLFANPVRRQAMLQARDSGAIAITPRTHLLVDEPTARTGLAVYLAIYAKGRRADTVAARQTSLRGWVYIAFRIRDLMASLYGESTPGIALRIYDGTDTTPDNLMFDSHPATEDEPPPRLTAIEYISFPQHSWTLQIRSTPAFEQNHSRRSASIIAIAGGAGSLLLAFLTWQLVTGRARAHSRAQAMTRELRESEERMRHMAQHDPLTHLPNRALFSDRLQAALALARRERHHAGLMFVDLDRFKAVNDLYGHAVGDQLLIAASARMRDCLRESDTLARMGGDEFVVLLPHIDSRTDAEHVADRIRASIADAFTLDGHRLQISASIGIGVFPDNGDNEERLMKSADDAMYRAKDTGRATHPA